MTAIITLCWLLIIVGSVVFLVLFGLPWRHPDRVMAWHLTLWVLSDIAERMGLLLAGVTLVPAAIIYVLTAVIVQWRLGLLIQTRRRAKARRRANAATADRDSPGEESESHTR
ncbi:MAG TPA: hypothetical protein VF163_11275 [Micromonosporaceae bacterium]